MTQPNRSSLKPQPKVAAGGAAGALTILVVYLLTTAGIELPAEAASALGVLITIGVSWITPQGPQSGGVSA